MKENIYTIPINDAFDSDCECPFCFLESKTENDSVEYTVGAAMMEPDFRLLTNEKGFCDKHFDMLINQQKFTPLSLIMQTHLADKSKELSPLLNIAAEAKKGLFKKAGDSSLKEGIIKLTDKIDDIRASCAVCHRMHDFMEHYARNTVYIWKKEEEFKRKFANATGFCLRHLAFILRSAVKELNEKELAAFYEVVKTIESKYITELKQDVDAYCNAFDYRSAPLTERQKTALLRGIDFCR